MAKIISRPYGPAGEANYERVFTCPKCEPTAAKLKECEGKPHCLFQNPSMTNAIETASKALCEEIDREHLKSYGPR